MVINVVAIQLVLIKMFCILFNLEEKYFMRFTSIKIEKLTVRANFIYFHI